MRYMIVCVCVCDALLCYVYSILHINISLMMYSVVSIFMRILSLLLCDSLNTTHTFHIHTSQMIFSKLVNCRFKINQRGNIGIRVLMSADSVDQVLGLAAALKYCSIHEEIHNTQNSIFLDFLNISTLD